MFVLGDGVKALDGIDFDQLLIAERPCRLFDGDGVEVLNCVEYDVFTGRCVRLVRDGGGFVVVDGDVCSFVEVRSLPFRVEWSKFRNLGVNAC